MAEPKKTVALDKTPPGSPPSDVRANAAKAASQDVGTALRNAFRATVEEEVPPEMLDLLRRLD